MTDAPDERPEEEREGEGDAPDTDRPAGVSEPRDSTSVNPQDPGEDAPYLQP